MAATFDANVALD